MKYEFARTLVFAISVLALASFCNIATAQDISERVERVPVKVVNLYGKRIEREIAVTIFEIAGRDRYPLLVFNHGRSGDARERANMGRVRYAAFSGWFASLGYSVWVLTRIGYGISGAEEDPEYSGECNNKHYAPGYDAAAEQTLQVIEHAKRRPEIDGRRIVSVGQSFGGMTSIAVASRNPAGLIAAINFAGGGGANPATPGEPCAASKISALFESYGKSTRVPTLWIYNENDRWFPPRYSKAWFEAFRSSGGTGRFLMEPAHGSDGHFYFLYGLTLWQPEVKTFLSEVK